MNKIYEFVETICTSLIIVCICFAFFFRMVSVDGSSMNATLSDNDKIILTYSHNIQRGDIVVTDNTNGSGKRLIKRVIAMGGDRIKIDFTKGEVYVNDELINETYILEPMMQKDYILDITVRDGYLFLMGDNRNNSLDSRYDEIGLISENEILGKASVRLFPKFTVLKGDK